MAGKHCNVDIGLGALPGSDASMAAYRPNFPGDQLDKAYRDGRLAQKRGALAGANPFPAGTARNRVWGNGWFNGTSNDISAKVQTHMDSA